MFGGGYRSVGTSLGARFEMFLMGRGHGKGLRLCGGECRDAWDLEWVVNAIEIHKSGFSLI